MALAEILADQLTPLSIVGHLSFGLTAASLAMRDMLLLRVLGLVSGLFGVVYNYLVPGGPLWLVIFWLGVFMLIHAFRVIEIIRERRGIQFTDEERELHATVFRGFDAVEFMRLLNVGERATFAPGDVLLNAGVHADRLYIILDGAVEITRDGASIALLKPGAAVGEISFLQDALTTASAAAAEPTRCLAFPTTALRALLARHPSMRLSMTGLLSGDLAAKLAGAR
jgi:hypothetical protein